MLQAARDFRQPPEIVNATTFKDMVMWAEEFDQFLGRKSTTWAGQAGYVRDFLRRRDGVALAPSQGREFWRPRRGRGGVARRRGAEAWRAHGCVRGGHTTACSIQAHSAARRLAPSPFEPVVAALV